jgi:hypothetical protein
LVSLFGIPDVWSISHFFGIPKFFLVDQIFFFGWPKKWEIDWTIGIPKKRDWPKVHGRRFNQLLLTFDFRAHQIEIHGTHNGDTSNHNSDGKTVKTIVVTYKNGSKTTTITEPIIDKPVSDISEDLQSGTKLTPDVTREVVIFPKFPTWDNFGPGIKATSMYFWSVSLVYQLSGQFLIFLVDHKNNLVDQKKFGIPKKNLVYQKKNLVYQK